MMNRNEALEIYRSVQEKLNALNYVYNISRFDEDTIAPRGGTDYRNRMMSVVSGEIFELQDREDYKEAVEYLSGLKLQDPLKREIELTKRYLDRVSCFTKEEEVEYALASARSHSAWQKARITEDFADMEEELKDLLSRRIERAKRKDPKKPFDVCLNQYEEGFSQAFCDPFFDLVKKELIPLIKKISKKQDRVDYSFLFTPLSRERQMEFTKVLTKFLNYTSDWGLVKETEHPFSTGFSRDDVRVTTHYYTENFCYGIFSTLHEVGHSYYEHQIPKKYEGTPIVRDLSFAIHESQSRFIENYIGRRRSFWVKLYPELQALYPEILGDKSLDDFVNAINASHCSLIRTEADELTYPVHILIRYEIEKGLFSGKISLEHLDQTWNAMYKKYLGIDVPNDRLGIMQDSHWAGGSIGYFPTYALGSAFGAQFLRQMEKDIDVDGELEKGNFKAVTDWLKQNIHRYGALYDYDELMVKVTGEHFDPKYYIDYLKEKYQKLYGIK